MISKRRHSLLIVGAGRIAALEDLPSDLVPRTHANAFRKTGRFSPPVFVDPDGKNLSNAVRRWGGEGYTTLAAALGSRRFSVAVVANPDARHSETLRALTHHPFRLVICEKPLATDLAEAWAICRLYDRLGIPLAVNYTRRLLPELKSLRRQIRAGSLGRFRSAVVYYGKGLLHNGSHAIDTLRFLLGELSSQRALRRTHDGLADDASWTATARLAGGDAFFVVLPQKDYTHFEIDLHFSKRRIRLLHGGLDLEESAPASDLAFPGHLRLKVVSRRRTELLKAPSLLALEALKILDKGRRPSCPAHEAFKTLTATTFLRNR